MDRPLRGREKLKKERRLFFNKVQSIIEKTNRVPNDIFISKYLSKYKPTLLGSFKSKLTKEDKLIISHNPEFFEGLQQEKQIFSFKYLHNDIISVKPELDKSITDLHDFMNGVKHKHEFQNRLKKKFSLMKYSNIDRLKEKYKEDKSYYMLVLTNNKKKVRLVLKTLDKDEAVSAFEKNISKYNRVVLPQVYEGGRKKVDYELILAKSSDEIDSNGYFRDPITGKFIKTIVTNKDNVTILNKSNVYVENDFFVYGFHPQKQRKTFSWIKDKIVDSYISKKKTMSIRIYANKIMFFNEDMSDFNMVICRNGFEADALVDKLKGFYPSNKYLHFLLRLKHSEEMKKHMLLIRNKTGWDLRAITHPYFYVAEDEY